MLWIMLHYVSLVQYVKWSKVSLSIAVHKHAMETATGTHVLY